MYKFVLLNSGALFIGSRNSYHSDICGHQPSSKVKAAGWLHFGSDGWECSGRSIGYDISYTEEDEEEIKSKLQSLTEEDLGIHYRNDVLCKE